MSLKRRSAPRSPEWWALYWLEGARDRVRRHRANYTEIKADIERWPRSEIEHWQLREYAARELRLEADAAADASMALEELRRIRTRTNEDDRR